MFINKSIPFRILLLKLKVFNGGIKIDHTPPPKLSRKEMENNIRKLLENNGSLFIHASDFK